MNQSQKRQLFKDGLNLSVAFSLGIALTANFYVLVSQAKADDTASSSNLHGVTNYTFNKNGSVKTSTLTPPPTPVAPKATDAKKTTTTTTTTTTTHPETAIVSQVKPIVSTNPKQWQVFRETFNLQPGQNTMPLTLKVTNGDAGHNEFQAIQVNVNGSKFAEQKEFKGPILTKGLVGLTPGANQFIFQTYGPIGSKLSWKILAAKFSIDSVSPTEMGPTDVVTIKGKGFTQGSTVTVGGKLVRMTSASPSELKFTVAEDTPGGKQDLLVTTGGINSKAYKVTVKIAPEVSGVNYVATAPSQPITVYGKHFSPTASDNTIIFTLTTGQTYTASATSATDTSIECVVPEMDCPVWNVSIKCKTNGLESKGSNITINVGQRVIPNDGIPQQ